MQIKQTKAFQLAYQFVNETKENVFLTGKAGTGKTTFLRYLRENSPRRVIVAAPTGVAAINAGGVTLHSLFQLPFAPYLPIVNLAGEAEPNRHFVRKIRFSQEKLEMLRKADVLVIDEVSMVAGWTIDAIDAILKHVRRRRKLPFGGLQVLFIGDLHQLQPVVKNEEWDLLKDNYPSAFFFDAFALRNQPPVAVELTEIFRQRDDNFISLLNSVRNNTLTSDQRDLLASRIRQTSPEKEPGTIMLTTHNFQADRVNEKMLSALAGEPRIFHAEIEGEFGDNQYPADDKLALKKGAQVMFLKNDNEGGRYYNGKIGTVTGFATDTIFIKCDNEEEEISLDRHTWDQVKYNIDPETREIVPDPIGSFVQFPLRLAWAITIHKSQGLTFDKVIVDAEKAFANGQVYVALSRCRSLDGLILNSPPGSTYLGAHQKLVEWESSSPTDEDLESQLQKSRAQFALAELKELFGFTNWRRDFDELRTVLNSKKEKLGDEWQAWINNLNSQISDIEEVGKKFVTQIDQWLKSNPQIETNQKLQERLQDASGYFAEKISSWQEAYRDFPVLFKTRKGSKEVQDVMNALNATVHETLYRVEFCEDGFELTTYLEDGRKAATPPPALDHSKALKQKDPEPEMVRPELYDKLAELRAEIADEEEVPRFIIFGNKALINVCHDLPTDEESLLKVKGFGKKKVDKYGTRVIEVVKKFKESI